MKSVAFLTISLLALAQGLALAENDDPKITDRKVSIVGFVDAGQVASGSLNGKHMSGSFLNRDGVALTYSGTINDNLHMNIGVGGLFWKAIPESDEQSKRILFGPGISEASANYDFS